MILRRIAILFVVFAATPVALAQPPADDPFGEKYTIRGVEAYDYSGYGDFADQVLSLVVRDGMDWPSKPTGDDESSGFANFTIFTDAALRRWQVRLLNVRMESRYPNPAKVEVHLRWPSDTSVLNTFPFDKVRSAFEHSSLGPDSPEWVAQRNRLWPDISATARRIAVSDKPIDVSACPDFLASLRRLRDTPPTLELIPRDTNLGEPRKSDGVVVVTADGWGVSLIWNGGPDQFDGGQTNPDQSSELGETLLHLVGDAEECAGIERTLP